MSSTYSTNLAIELIGTGDQAGQWGNTTNTNLGTLIEQAISGYVTQAVSTGTDTTITIPNGATGVARNMYIELTGTGGTNTNLIVPANKKLYFIFNNTSSGQVTVKVSGQTGVSVPNKAKVILVSNGTDVIDATNYIGSATIGNLTATSATITTLTSTSANITTLVATNFTSTNQATIDGMAVGQGGGNVASNTAVGVSALTANTTGAQNTAIGYQAIKTNSTSSNNTAVGYQALENATTAGNTAVGNRAANNVTSGSNVTAVGDRALFTNSTGAFNDAYGYLSLYLNTTGSYNVALGNNALYSNTTANNSTAVGHQAGYSNTTGAENTFVGQTAGYSNQTNTQLTFVGVSAGYYMRGSYNTGLGWNAMAGSTTAANNTGTYNTALGRSTLYVLTSGSRNTAIGNTALNQTSTGSDNTAVGNAALEVNTTGTYNVAVGAYALDANTTANYNTAVGYGSLTSTTAADNSGFGRDSGAACTSGTANTFIGARAGDAVTTGSYNILVGFQSGAYDGLGNAKLTTGSFNTQIGYACAMSASTVSGEMLIASGGYNFVGKGANTGFIQPNGGGVYQGNNSANWSTTSDQRLKKNIADNTIGLEKIKQIRVRNFEYRLPEEVDAELKPTDAIAKSGVQLGVIAQELQQVLPECVKQESTGVMSVDPDNLTWYLINAVKELSAQVEELKAKLGDK